MAKGNNAANGDFRSQAEASELSPKLCTPLALFLASFLALYFEIVIIRYLSTEIRVFAYFKNLPLISSFLGLGLGMTLGRPPRILKQFFPFVASVLFLLIAFASWLRLTTIPAPGEDYLLLSQREVVTHLAGALRYMFITLFLIALVVAFFVVLGGLVGENLSKMPPLRGYSINLAGSLAGIGGFTVFCYWRWPPGLWLLFGFLVALPFIYREARAVLMFAVVIIVVTATGGGAYWSPYYRIDLLPNSPPAAWPHPAIFVLTVNHDVHQAIFDLSQAFVEKYPAMEPNRTMREIYDLPYHLIQTPKDILIVGVGTGNDVAAALRHGAEHVDAVEIDPTILDLGRQFHPEHPYDSPRVSIHNDDARAFFHKTRRKYDLIVFGFLDSVTLLSSYSSVRLDNYVYTVESFRETRNLLRDGGTLDLTFATHRPFLTERLYVTLTEAFGVSPQSYRLPFYNTAFIEGVGRNRAVIPRFQDISEEVAKQKDGVRAATDQWPFLYLARPTIPKSILWVLVPFLIGAGILVHKTVGLANCGSRQAIHFFLLGAGFLLLETKGVTELSLLFGSTWIVNAVVIGAFLTMALLANTYVEFRPVSLKLAYVMIFLVLLVGMLVPYARLESFPSVGRVLVAAVLIGLPVFFAGLIFSRSFRDMQTPARALGFNLLGAVVGGTLENAVMLGGTHVLGVLSILLYGLSAIYVGE